MADNDASNAMGVATASFALLVGLISRLKNKGVLTEADVKLIADEAALSLEEFVGIHDPAMQGAHGLIEMVYRLASASHTPPKPTQPNAS